MRRPSGSPTGDPEGRSAGPAGPRSSSLIPASPREAITLYLVRLWDSLTTPMNSVDGSLLRRPPDRIEDVLACSVVTAVRVDHRRGANERSRP